MKRLLLLLWVALAACGGWPSEQPEHAEAAQLYTCGMHPQVVQEGPGSCPICGMDLTPMKEATAQPTDETQVYVPSHIIQRMGVRTAPVRRQTIFKHLRTVGEVEVAEDQVAVVNLRLSGWVERIRVERTGDPVRRGQVLFDLYAPELVAAQEELLLALRNEGPEGRLTQSARRKLDLWDIARSDIEAVIAKGEAQRTLPIRSPADGFVLHKDITEGASVKAGQDLYRIGNLQTIWVNAEVYEFDAPWVEPDQPAQMELSFQKGTVLTGKVGYIHPTLNPRTRTLRVRLEFDNPGIALKPGMLATVYIQFRRRDDTLAIPTEAIVETGERSLVFLAEGAGHFAPREVVTGLEADHHMTEVLSGLSEGEVVVTSGQFLIDSESQLQEAVQKLIATRAGVPQADDVADTVFSCPMHPEVVQGTPGRCPTCGMFLEARPAEDGELATAAHDGHDHEVKEHPEGTTFACPMHPEIVQDTPGKCSICGMFLQPVPPAE